MSLKNFVSYDPESKIWKGLKSLRVYNNEVSVGYLILNVIKQTPTRVMEICHDNGVASTCIEIYEKSVKIINFLSNSGFRQNDVAGFVAMNSFNLTPVLNACLTLGLPINPLTTQMNEQDIIHSFSNTKPKIIFCDFDVVEKVQKCCEIMQLQAKIVTMIEKVDGYEFVDDILKVDVDLDDFVFPDLKDISSSYAFMLCSSGTTDKIKAVCKSHKQIITQFIPPWKILADQNEILFAPTGIFWITQMFMFIFTPLYKMTRVITAKNLDVKIINEVVLKHKVTFLFIQPFFVREILQCKEILPMESVRNCMVGGEQLDKELLDNVQESLPHAMISAAYGCTEMDILTYGHQEQKGCGHIYGDVQLKIVDENNCNLGPNETGEICVKTPVAFSGYYNQPDKYKDAFKDGWFYMGDLGYMDEDGFLYVNARKKLLLKYRGYQITPLEVEQVINEIKGITESCVVGVFDTKESNHILYAFATKAKEIDLTEKFVKEYVNSTVSDYKKIRGSVTLLDEFPRTHTGKIDSNKLREMAENAHFKR